MRNGSCANLPQFKNCNYSVAYSRLPQTSKMGDFHNGLEVLTVGAKSFILEGKGRPEYASATLPQIFTNYIISIISSILQT